MGKIPASQRAGAVKEIDVQCGIVEYLQRIRHVYCWRQNTGGFMRDGHFYRFGIKGMADILGVLYPTGRILAIEVKRPGEKPTAEQQRFLDDVNGSGGLAFVATSVQDVIDRVG